MRNLSTAFAVLVLVTFTMPIYANTNYEGEANEASTPDKPKKTRKSKIARETQEVREMREARRANDTNDTVLGYAWIRTKIEDESAESGSKLFIHHMFSKNFGLNFSHIRSYGKYTEHYYLDLYPEEPVYAYDLELEANNIAFIASTSAEQDVSYFGKFGVSIWRAEVTSHPPGYGDESGTGALLGAGIRINTGKRAVVTLEYETIELNDRDATGFTASIGFRF